MDDYALNDDDLLSALQNNSSAPENKAKKQEQFKKMIYSLGEHNRTQPKEKPKPAPKEKLENIISYLNINSTSTEHSDPYESIFKKLTRHVRVNCESFALPYLFYHMNRNLKQII